MGGDTLRTRNSFAQFIPPLVPLLGMLSRRFNEIKSPRQLALTIFIRQNSNYFCLGGGRRKGREGETTLDVNNDFHNSIFIKTEKPLLFAVYYEFARVHKRA